MSSLRCWLLILGMGLLAGIARADGPAPLLPAARSPGSPALRAAPCPKGAADCNPCVNGVRRQFEDLFHGDPVIETHDWRFEWNRPLPPEGIKPLAAILRKGRASRNHVQGFARTNSATYPFVMSHSDFQHGGTVSFIRRRGKTLELAATVRLHHSHPSGVAVLGRYAFVADKKVIRVFDVENPGAAPVEVAAPEPGFAGAGGGLAVAKLEDGRYLLLVATPGGYRVRPRLTRFFALEAPLSREQRATFLGEWRYEQPADWSDDFEYSENVSLVSECGSGKLYTLHATGEPGNRGEGYFRLSRVRLGPTPHLETLAGFWMPQSQGSCHLRSSGTAWASRDHKLELYCHERGATDGWGVFSGESFYFRRRFLR